MSTYIQEIWNKPKMSTTQKREQKIEGTESNKKIKNREQRSK